MKKLFVLLLCATLVFAVMACKPAEPAAADPSAPPAPAATAEAPAPEAPEAPAPQALSKYAQEAAKAQSIYTVDTYFSNSENYKDFGADGEYKVAFICKFITSSWFAPKSQGMQDRANELGINYIGIDANNSDDAFLQGVQNAINQNVDAIILTPPTASLLPATIDMCQEAGVAYITTDDGGYDSEGNRIPHLGLDDFGLAYVSGRAVAQAAVERNFDISKLKIVMLDAPAVESIHNRCLGAYQAVMDHLPGVTEDHFVWLDTIDNLTNNNITKFSAAFQQYKGGTENWMVFCLGDNVWDTAFPIFDENGIDYANVLCGGLAVDNTISGATAASEAKANCLFLSGILPAPSGRALIDLCDDLFKNGNVFPDFSGYPELLVYSNTFNDWAKNFE